MTFIPALLKSGWNRWWGIGLLVAAPALALAVLGLRAVRAERIEREQQLLEQQAQSARLADGALANLFEDLARRLRLKDGADHTAIESSFTLLSLDRSGVLRFMRERVYFGDSSEHQAAWPARIEILVEEAQAAPGASFSDVSRVSSLMCQTASGAWRNLSCRESRRFALTA